MENDSNIDQTNVRHRVRAPEQSSISTFLNGVGNFWMLGTVPFIAAEFYSNISGKPLPKEFHMGSLAITVGSCAIGAVLGAREARQLNTYRHALANELDTLHDRIDADNNKIAALTRALEAKEQQAAPAR